MYNVKPILIARQTSEGLYETIQKGYELRGHKEVVLTDSRFEVSELGVTRASVLAKARKYGLQIEWQPQKIKPTMHTGGLKLRDPSALSYEGK